MKLFENTPISTAKEILSKALILGAEGTLRDMELQYMHAEEEVRRLLMYNIGRHIGEQLQDFSTVYVKERDFPEEFKRIFRAEVVVLTKDQYYTLVSAIDTLERREQFKSLDSYSNLGV